jgi:hypothetical protein
MNNIKVIKISSDKLTKPTSDLLSSSSKIKEILERKGRINPETKFKNQFSPTKQHPQQPQRSHRRQQRQRHYKTKKQTTIKKKKNMTIKEINIYYKEITNEKNINLINKENLLVIFQKILFENDINLTNKFIKLINRKQLILILSSLDIVSRKTQAPIPLLKNLLYNYLTSQIKIII